MPALTPFDWGTHVIGPLWVGDGTDIPGQGGADGLNPALVIDVTARGAVGDGVTNDTAAVQAAIDAAAATAAIVLFPPTATSYRINGTLTNTSNVPLVFFGGSGRFSGAGAPTANMLEIGARGTLTTTALTLPAVVTSVAGVIFKGTNRFLHDYAASTSDGLNTFLGILSGNFTMGPAGGASSLGSTNSGLGARTLQALTTGYNNAAVGAWAMNLNTTGYSNAAVGVSALSANTTGFNNVAVGQGALAATLTGTQLVALGQFALNALSSGSYDVAVGAAALQTATTASYNTAVGDSSLGKLTIANNNTAIGESALGNLTIGSENVGIGQGALQALTTATGNVALGRRAGFYETGSNTLFIDNQQRINEADGRIKALIYGIFAAATADQTLTVNGHIKSVESILSSSPTKGIGYTTGAGGTVTQATSKSTGVTMNTVCGEITLNGAALAGDTTVSFVLTDSAIAATDVLILNHVSVGTFGSYSLNGRCASGSATIDVRNITTGSLSEAIVLRFVVVKGVTS